MRLNTKAFALSCGIVWGAAVLLATVWLKIFGFEGQVGEAGEVLLHHQLVGFHHQCPGFCVGHRTVFYVVEGDFHEMPDTPVEFAGFVLGPA